MLDANHDGRVNAEELKGMLDRLGISVDDQVVKKLLSEASKNGKIISMLNYLQCNSILLLFYYCFVSHIFKANHSQNNS